MKFYLFILCMLFSSASFSQIQNPLLEIENSDSTAYLVNNHLWRGVNSPFYYFKDRDITSTTYISGKDKKYNFPGCEKIATYISITVKARYDKMVLDSCYKTSIPSIYVTRAKHVSGSKVIDSSSQFLLFNRESVYMNGESYKVADIPVSFDSDVVYMLVKDGKQIRIDLDYDRQREKFSGVKGWYHCMVTSPDGQWYWDITPTSIKFPYATR